MKYGDILDLLMQRAERLGLVDAATQQADAAELQLYMYQALLSLTEAVDLPEYLVQNELIATTTAGHTVYTLPPDFGRLIMQRVNAKRGIYLFDTIDNTDLDYLDPNSFARQVAPQNGRPDAFTVTGRSLWVFPPPDSNTGQQYTLKGLYVARVSRPDLDDEVVLTHPVALITEALFLLSADMNKTNQGLNATRTEALARLAAGAH